MVEASPRLPRFLFTIIHANFNMSEKCGKDELKVHDRISATHQLLIHLFHIGLHLVVQAKIALHFLPRERVK